MTQVNWNGRDLPEELKALPPGRYVVYPAEGVLELNPEVDADLRSALDEVAREDTVPHENVVQRIQAALKR